MSEDLMIKCLIAFILGWLLCRMTGNGFSICGNGFAIGGEGTKGAPVTNSDTLCKDAKNYSESFSESCATFCTGMNKSLIEAQKASCPTAPGTTPPGTPPACNTYSKEKCPGGRCYWYSSIRGGRCRDSRR